MSLLQQAALLVAFITLRSGEFSFFLHGIKYNATIVVTDHTLPLGRFTLAQALDTVKKLANLSNMPYSTTVRIGAQDYTLNVVTA